MRTQMKQTSIDSYLVLRGKGTDLNQKGIIVSRLRRCFVPLTRTEISDKTGLTINAVCGRVNELINDGWLAELPRRKCTITGSEAYPLKVLK